MKSLQMILVFLGASVFFLSCLSPQKVAQWNDKHPVAASGYCAAHWPCVPGDTTIHQWGDSALYNKAIASLKKHYEERRRLQQQLIDSLIADSACAHYVEVVRRIPSDPDTVELPPIFLNTDRYIPYADSAEVAYWKGLFKATDREGTAVKKKSEQQAYALKIRFWIIVALAISTVFLLYLHLHPYVARAKKWFT